VLGSAALAANDVVMVAPNCLVSANGDGPQIERVMEATIHMADVPVMIGTPGTPNIVAALTFGNATGRLGNGSRDDG
jgi:hypothetical protein